MSDDFESLWTSMRSEASGIKGGILRRRLTAARDDGLFLGLDLVKGQRLFIVELAPHVQFKPRNIPNWREIQVELATDDESPDVILVKIALISERFTDVFTAFANDLYKTLSPIGKQPNLPYVLSDRFENWHRFFMTHSSEGLSHEEQLGLFGELWFMLHHILCRLPKPAALKCWKGPEEKVHDFELPGGSVEVKTTGTKEPRAFRISSEYQLDTAGIPSLHLYVLSVETRGSGGETLPELVSELRTEFEAEQAVSDLFRQKLMEAGYLDIHAAEYTARYEVVEEFLFGVENGFPSIVEVPEGVSEVKYKISLSACLRFQVDLETSLLPILDGLES